MTNVVKMSENVRVCQFYLRGRCKREKCEFKHPQELVNRPQVSLSKSGSVERSRSKDRKVRIYESDEDRIDSSDDDNEELRERQRRRVKVVKCLSLLFSF